MVLCKLYNKILDIPINKNENIHSLKIKLIEQIGCSFYNIKTYIKQNNKIKILNDYHIIDKNMIINVVICPEICMYHN